MLALLTAVAIGGCGTGERPQTPQPRAGRAGLQLSGTVGGSQVAVSDGSPRFVVGDCDVAGGVDDDLCVESRDLRGGPVLVVVRNPGVLVEGTAVTIDDAGCDGEACDAVTDTAVVDVQLGDDAHRRATGGAITLRVVDDERRYAGRLRIELRDGVLSGHFDLVPRPR